MTITLTRTIVLMALSTPFSGAARADILQILAPDGRCLVATSESTSYYRSEDGGGSGSVSPGFVYVSDSPCQPGEGLWRSDPAQHVMSLSGTKLCLSMTRSRMSSTKPVLLETSTRSGDCLTFGHKSNGGIGQIRDTWADGVERCMQIEERRSSGVEPRVSMAPCDGSDRQNFRLDFDFSKLKPTASTGSVRSSYYEKLTGYCRGEGHNTNGWPHSKGRLTDTACRTACEQDAGCTAFEIESGSGDVYNCWTYGHAQPAGEPGGDARCYKRYRP